MTIASYLPGQRWVSNTESELGLGIVMDASNRRVEVSFPAAGERRVYAVDNAPLSRVEYQVGEEINTESGLLLTIEAVMEANGCLIYNGVNDSGEAVVVPEQDLNSNVQFSKPQDRLFAGQIDKNMSFELRHETLEHCRRHQQSSVRGLLGPRVQLLPHQLYLASEVAGRHAPRVLLADEVGLGKTIEAGLILHQKLISGTAKRVLIVVPDSLLHQWLVEMLRRFNLMFSIIDQGDIDQDDIDLDYIDPDEVDEENLFEGSQLCLCTLSFLTDNPGRHAQAMAAHWDLLIVDEAHHLHWSQQEASPEYSCIEALARQAQGLLLLTATPEQLGIESHFARLRLLDPDRYYDLQSFIEEERNHQPVNQLVQSLLATDVREHLQQQDDLIEQLQGYLGEDAVAPLLRVLEAGTTAQFESALKNVIRDLLDRHGTGRVLFRNTRASVGGFPARELNLYPLTAPETYRGSTVDAAPGALLNPELLLGESWITEDPRVQWLGDWLAENRGEKVLVICAHAATAIALEEHLRLRSGVMSATFHEELTLIARDRAAAYFADEEQGAQVLVSSEIGSEGRNFQFAHHLVLFDLPLNPDLLEQRIGRLDRIGQINTVQIHAPFYEFSAQSVLLSWYHEGLNAIEQTCPAGQTLFEHFEKDLLQVCRQPDDKKSLAKLLKMSQKKTTELLLELQLGRDRLLELNSFNRDHADEIVGEMVADERRKELSGFMDQVLDHFGVEQDHHSTNSLVLRPGDHMLVHSFPGLPEDGMTATYQRDLALSREDMQYLSWEHPMVTGAVDLVLNGEFGNTAFCIVKLPPLKPGTIMLEAIFTLSCIAPGELQLQRYLPLTTLRLLIDSRNADLTKILSHAHLSRLAQEARLHNARELVGATRPRITAMLEHVEKLAEEQKSGVLENAMATMKAEQKVELERLQALAAINPNIREEEVQHVKDTTDLLENYLGHAQLRLDAIRVAMVTE